jgi:hypothetical protein
MKRYDALVIALVGCALCAMTGHPGGALFFAFIAIYLL